MVTSPYTIKTEAYQGPFHLLLSLIEERKFFINDLSLSQGTEDYLKYINTMSEKDTVEISNFIVVAATLILIKSKSLLQNLALTDAEKSDIGKLEERLKLYELYTGLAKHIIKKFGKEIIFPGEERKHEVFVFLPDDKITKENMMTLAQGALDRLPKKTVLQKVEVRKVISIEEMISKLTERIEKSIEMNFKDFAGGAKTKEEKVFVIIGFLAMLELVRQGILHVVQEENFDNIVISKNVNISQNSE